jgi:hypothetical protein
MEGCQRLGVVFAVGVALRVGDGAYLLLCLGETGLLVKYQYEVCP